MPFRRASGFWTQLVLLLVLLAAVPAPAQTVGDRAGDQMAFLPVNARSAALGDASGTLSGGIEGVHSNPAVLAWLAGPRFEYSYQRLSPAYALQHLGAGFRTGRSSAASLHLDLLHHGGLTFYSRSDLRARGFELRAGGAWAVMLMHDLSAGLQARMAHATTDADPVWAFSADAGLIYRPTRYHTVGLALRDFGTDYAITRPVLPPDVSDVRPSRIISLSAALYFPLDAGAQVLVLSFENDKMIGRRGLLYKAGLEYRPLPFAALRGGIQIRGEDVEPGGGAGLATGSVHVDYAYRYRQGSPPVHLLTLGYAPD